jgi:stage III sporulation protein SpoIIIAA
MTRLQVNTRGELFEVMLDAVQNHSTRVVVIDEIRDTEEEAATQTK